VKGDGSRADTYRGAGLRPNPFQREEKSMAVNTWWWSEADQAELEVAIYDFLSVVEDHKDCEACSEAKLVGRRFCEPIIKAIEALCDWKEKRDLLSRAEFYRSWRNAK
jgi:hypothetical protein